MAIKFSFVLCLLVISIVVVYGAPKAITSEEELKKSVIQFLKQDKEFMADMAKMQLADNMRLTSLRSRRQTEVEVDTGTDSVQGDEQPGFFDRAAKFIVDLLQRFLKWINSDSN